MSAQETKLITGTIAPETKLTAQTNPDLVSTDSSLTFHSSNREVLRITNEAKLIIGEGLSEDEATQKVANLLIAAFDEQIQKMVDKRVSELKYELKKAEKKNYREEVKTYNDLQARIANQVERIRHLESLALARAEKLEADTKRLDWLSSQERIDYDNGYWLRSHLGQHPNRTLRAVIDAAMKEVSK